MDAATGGTRSLVGPPTVISASRTPLPLVAAALLLLLVVFVVWPVLRVLVASLTGPTGLTLAHYAEFFSSWRLVRILVQSLVVSAVSTVFTVAVVSQVFTFVPQAYLLIANVLGNIDVSLEEAAENLGAGPLTTLRRVTLSLARPGLASAALIVFILCLTDFGNPILIGGRY